MTAPLRIAIVNHDDLSIWLFRRGLIKRLIADGHQVDVICDHGPLIDKITGLGARHVPLSLPRLITPMADLRGILAMVRLFRRGRYDLVHLFQNKIILYGALAARAARVPRVVASSTGIGFIMNDFPGLRDRIVQGIVRALYRVSLPRIDRVLFQNQEDRDHFCAAGIVAPERTVIVKGSGIDLAEYNRAACDPALMAEVKARIGEPDGRVVIGMVARVVRTKGVLEMLEAARALEERLPGKARIVLVGGPEPSNPEYVDPEVVRRAEGPHLVWLGWLDAVREVYAHCDIAILPSYREGTPRALLEAMAMGLPLVTTDAPGCRNVIEDGRNGFKVPVGDAAALTDAIARLVEDPDLRRTFGQRSYEKVRDELSDDVVVNGIVHDLYGFPKSADGASPGTLTLGAPTARMG